MKEPEDLTYRNFGLYERHISFLNQINEDNHASALRTVLDSIINGHEQIKRKQMLDNTLNYIALGFILCFIGYLTDLLPVKAIIFCFGIFMFSYGIIGGVLDAVQRKHRTK